MCSTTNKLKKEPGSRQKEESRVRLFVSLENYFLSSRVGFIFFILTHAL